MSPVKRPHDVEIGDEARLLEDTKWYCILWREMGRVLKIRRLDKQVGYIVVSPIELFKSLENSDMEDMTYLCNEICGKAG